MHPMRSARSDAPQLVSQREMTAALSGGELELYFQPIVVLGTGRIRGVEALIRWHHPRGTVLTPDAFLPSVAHTPLMQRITTWVIERACAQAATWDSWTMSVNIAAADAVQPSLAEAVEDSLRRHRVPPERLIVELTEHAAVQELAAATGVLQQLRERGVGVALDDFGTGYSSLLYLRDLPVSEVKIDRTFVNGVEGHEDDAAIVHSVVMLASAVGLAVVAEGVETPGQARYLRRIGCACAQGYRFARPAPAASVPLELDASLFDPYPSVGRARTRRPELRAVPPEAAATMTALVSDGASLHTIAAALNSNGLLTGSGKRWTAAAVARALHDGRATAT